MNIFNELKLKFLASAGLGAILALLETPVWLSVIIFIGFIFTVVKDCTYDD